MPVTRADGVLIHFVGKTFVRGVVWATGAVCNLTKCTYGPFSQIL